MTGMRRCINRISILNYNSKYTDILYRYSDFARKKLCAKALQKNWNGRTSPERATSGYEIYHCIAEAHFTPDRSV
jgi:hypothetical protein